MSEFVGIGNYEEFVKKCGDAMTALREGSVILPPRVEGEASFTIEGEGEGAKLVLDLRETPVFSTTGIKVTSNLGTPTQVSVTMINDRLNVHITLDT